MHLESKDTLVNKSIDELWSYVDDPEKMRSLMPESVTKFEVNNNGYKIAIKGVPLDIAFSIKEKITNEKLLLTSANPSLDFDLIINSQGLNATQSMIKVIFDGRLNPMVKMMVQKPLQKFLDDLSEKATLL